MCAVSIVSCSKTEAPAKVEFSSLKDSVMVVPSGSGMYNVQFYSSGEWSASLLNDRADSWCTVSPATGQEGVSVVTVSVVENGEFDDRNATLTVRTRNVEKSVQIIQKQKDVLVITSSVFELPVEGGDIEVGISSNVDYDYEIISVEKDWIEETGTKSLTASAITFNVGRNSSLNSRNAIIVFSDGSLCDSVMVFQHGEKPSIVLEGDTYQVKSEGETFKVDVVNNVDVEVRIDYPLGGDVWLVENRTKAFSTNTFYFQAYPNDRYDARCAQLIFCNRENNVADTLQVNQAGKSAIILSQDLYEVDSKGCVISVKMNTNVDVVAHIMEDGLGWISPIETKVLKGEIMMFDIAPFQGGVRCGTIVFRGGNVEQTVKVCQRSEEFIGQKEREALIGFYKVAGGENWQNNANWCSERPLDEWFGVTVANGRVVGVANNEGVGTNNIRGDISTILNALKGLDSLAVLDFRGYNDISGSVPDAIGEFGALKYIAMEGNPWGEGLHGALTAQLANLTRLEYFSVRGNKLTGEVPRCIAENVNFKYFWPKVIYQRSGYGFKEVMIPANDNVVACYDGEYLDLGGEYRKNKYTLLVRWDVQSEASPQLISEIASLYGKYGSKGLGVIGMTGPKYSNPQLDMFTQSLGNCKVFWETGDNNPYSWNDGEYLFGFEVSPLVYLIDNKGFINYAHTVDNLYGFQPFSDTGVTDYVDEIFAVKEIGENEPVDGNVVTLQRAKTGKGIDIVFMGDAFSAASISNGLYSSTMRTAMEKFFSEEPYKSFRDYFNVYSITVVSPFDGYGPNGPGGSRKSALETFFGEGTLVGGNDEKVVDYAVKALGEERIDAALLIVMMNSSKYAGTCYMYYPRGGDYGNGMSISYFPIGTDETALGQVLCHEACGHGFAKLADEYAYESYGTVPESEKSSAKYVMGYGWYKNVDFTSDRLAVKWAKFLADSRYSDEGLGVFEGGMTYWRGVWRPSENSIMRHNTGGFNAPGREAIYIRMHKLAFGEEWRYDYEDFVEWDTGCRSSSGVVMWQTGTIPHVFVPLHPPVVVGHRR